MQIVAYGSYVPAPGNTLVSVLVTAEKTDAPCKGQREHDRRSAGTEARRPTDWSAAIGMTSGTWDVTATITTVDSAKMQRTTPAMGLRRRRRGEMTAEVRPSLTLPARTTHSGYQQNRAPRLPNCPF